VIISDEWVPPRGPDWDAIGIRWPEGRTNGLSELLEERAADWPAMSASARAAHAEFFAPDVSFHRVLECCRELQVTSRPAPPPRAAFRTRAFVAAVRQRLAARVEP
jgi:hypothetical protein